ncbi:MAG: hypothetical protein JNK82_13820 [Myxococcaceae bacterium]|nr:hypothetical protein [Myxococcaceae bacterium]
MLTALALTLCLNGIDASHFAGALSDEPLAELGDVPVANLTPEQMKVEMIRLEPYRTKFIGPTVMSGVGAVLIIVGAVFGVAGVLAAIVPRLATTMMSTALTAVQVAGYVFIGLGGVALITGGILLAVGLTRLFPALERRREAMERREEIQKRLDAMDPQKNPLPEAPKGAKPGDVLWLGPESSMLVATF